MKIDAVMGGAVHSMGFVGSLTGIHAVLVVELGVYHRHLGP